MPSETSYNSHIWKKRARRQLRAEPLCAVGLDADAESGFPIDRNHPFWRGSLG
jgi:hypothetical protein